MPWLLPSPLQKVPSPIGFDNQRTGFSVTTVSSPLKKFRQPRGALPNSLCAAVADGRYIAKKFSSWRHASSALSENRCLPSAERYDSVFVGNAPGHFHAERADRHARDRKPSYACWPFGQHTLHIRNWHMTFEGHPSDDGGMARCQPRLHAKPLVEARAVGIVDDLDGLTEFLGDLGHPGFAAAAARVAVHDDIARRHRRRRNKRK